MRTLALILANWALLSVSSLHAAPYDQQMSAMAQSLADKFKLAEVKKLTVIEFTDTDGHRSDFGRFLTEELSVNLTMVESGSKGVSVQSGIRLPKSMRANPEAGLAAAGSTLGSIPAFAGIDVLVLGEYTVSQETITLSVKAISTKTGEVFAAERKQFDKSKDLATLIEKGADTSDLQDYPQNPGFYAATGDDWTPLLELERKSRLRPQEDIARELQAGPEDLVLEGEVVLARTTEPPIVSADNLSFVCRLDPTNITPQVTEALQAGKPSSIYQMPSMMNNEWRIPSYFIPSQKAKGSSLRVAQQVPTQYKGDGVIVFTPKQSFAEGGYLFWGKKSCFVFQVKNTNSGGSSKNTSSSGAINPADVPGFAGVYVCQGTHSERLSLAKEKLISARAVRGLVYDPNDPNPTQEVTAGYSCGRDIPQVYGTNLTLAVQGDWSDITKFFKTDHSKFVLFRLKQEAPTQWTAEYDFDPHTKLRSYSEPNVFGIGKGKLKSEIEEVGDGLHLIHFAKKLSSGFYGLCIDAGYFIFEVKN